jgi:hypothetical protein
VTWALDRRELLVILLAVGSLDLRGTLNREMLVMLGGGFDLEWKGGMKGMVLGGVNIKVIPRYMMDIKG